MGSKRLARQSIRCPHENEGRYTRQTKEIKIRLNPKTGEQIQEYHRGQTRDTYTIPWDKKTADLILTGEKYFGKDSINTTTPRQKFNMLPSSRW